MKSAVFFDFDNTLIRGYSQVLLVKYLIKKRMFPIHVFCGILIWQLLYKLKITNDVSVVQKKSIEAIRGWSLSKLKNLTKQFFDIEIKKRIFNAGKQLVDEHFQKGREVVVVSSSLDVILDSVKEYFGIHNVLCTKLEVQNDKYTGRILGKGMYGKQKVKAVKEFALRKGIDLKKSYAYSDHISDLDLLESVGHAVAVNPDDRLMIVCKQRGWGTLRFH